MLRTAGSLLLCLVAVGMALAETSDNLILLSNVPGGVYDMQLAGEDRRESREMMLVR